MLRFERSSSKGRRWQTTVLAVALPIASISLMRCSEPAGTEERLLRGADITLGQGLARTEVTLDKSGNPLSIAVVLSETALTGLPATTPQGGLEVLLPLPAGLPALAFDHVALNWQAGGHPPPGIYNRPHFDLHFYMITMQQRDAMTPADPQFAVKTLRTPTADNLPANYVTDGTAIPRMGSHWNDRNAPEHHGTAFTTTLIYGFFDGAMAFIEPMITREFLESRVAQQSRMTIPARYPRPGHYPSEWRITFDSARREHRIELLSFVARP
ncbi:MAG: DUF5602 domain-containing protein [Longimicrobiales bacterium]